MNRIFECFECFRKFMAKLNSIFWKGEREAAHNQLPHKAFQGFKEKDLWRAEEVALMCSAMFLTFCNIHRNIPVLESLFNQVADFQHLYVSLCILQNFYCMFFKYTSQWLLLEEHWISLKIMWIAAVINILHYYQKES